MRRLVAVAGVMLLFAPACGAGSEAVRTVRVDFQHDEFASYYWRYFPRSIAVHPGDTIVFRQEWTGEPHTVTLGRLVDRAIPRIEAVEQKYEDVDVESDPELIRKADAEFAAASKGLPTFFDSASQNAAIPCYLRRGAPPTDPDTPCPQSRRKQPGFDGRQSYYSSGFIPPEGPTGNTFRVPLSDDIAPGTYRYYCVIHFPFMQGQIVVRPRGSELPPEAAVNAQARREIERLASPLRRALAEARKGEAESAGERLRLPLAGYHSGEEFTVGISEFMPRTTTARVGEPVTWTIVGPHTISFDVPRYIPIYFVSRDGTVRRNAKVDRAAGGSPKPPPVDFEKGPFRIDGGTWDGDGFFSSGLIGSEPYSTYTLRVSQPGRYRYACLVHPKMVGTLVVRE